MTRTLSYVVLLAIVLPSVGCTTMKTTNTSRTGIEQLLISGAVDKSLNKIDFTPFQGQKVFLDEKYLDAVDNKYIISSLRHRLFKSGAQIVGKAADAQIIVEARSGGVGTDNSDSFLGVPEITLPGMLTLPEVRVLTRAEQSGIAKIGLVAYDAKTKQILGDGGMSLAKSDDSNTSILGVTVYQDGSARREVRQGVAVRKRAPQSAVKVSQAVAFSPSAAGSARMLAPANQSGQNNPNIQFASQSKVKQMSGEAPFSPPKSAPAQNGKVPAWYLK